MIKIRLFAVAAFVVLTFCPTSIRGDTLSGSVFYDGLANGVFTGFFNMSFGGTSSVGTHFSASVFGASISDINAPRLLANEHGGTSLNLGSSAFLDSTDFFFGSSVIINGISYPPSFVAVSITSNVVTIPFTTDPTIVFRGPCLVRVDVNGGGHVAGANGICDATLTLVRTGTDSLGFGTYTSESVRYELASVPTPEPATSVLLGVGLAGIVIKVRNRRNVD